MAGKGAGTVLVGYTKTLVQTVLFPLLWVKAMALAGRHSEADPRARAKVAVAIVASIAIGVAGIGMLLAFTENATTGIYDTLDDRMKTRTLEQEYQDQGAIITAKNIQLPIVAENLVDRNALVTSNVDRIFQDTGKRDAFNTAWGKLQSQATSIVEQARAGNKPEMTGYETQTETVLALWADALADEEEGLQTELGSVVKEATNLPVTQATAELELYNAQSRREALEGHHALYLNVQPYIVARDDAEVYARLNSFNAAHPNSKDKIDMENVDLAYSLKDDAVSDMTHFMNWFVWPGLIGAFFAPLAFALGSILKKAWVPSESVGFKPYPGAAAGWFLLFGAFGVPALPFAAWVFFDTEVRSQTGQISL